MSENRVRYRLSVSPPLNERMEVLGQRLGVHPQQAAYLCMGLGLRTLEQLTEMVEKAAQNPQMMAMIASHMEEENKAEADKLVADVLEQ